VRQNWSVLKSTGQAEKPKVHIIYSVFWSEEIMQESFSIHEYDNQLLSCWSILCQSMKGL
jgi:hypothetical protein